MMEDWQQRTQLLLGDEKMERLRQAHVLVVGLGGVGAYAAEMICRAGVGRMTIVDADTVQPTNINRQLPALHSTLGRRRRSYWQHVSGTLIRTYWTDSVARISERR